MLRNHFPFRSSYCHHQLYITWRRTYGCESQRKRSLHLLRRLFFLRYWADERKLPVWGKLASWINLCMVYILRSLRLLTTCNLALFYDVVSPLEEI